MRYEITTNIRAFYTTIYVGYFSVLELSNLEKNANVCCKFKILLYQFQLDRNYLTTESAENTEKDRREMSNSDINRFDVMCVNI